MTVVSPKHFVEAENSLLILKSLLTKSDLEQQAEHAYGARSSSSGHGVLQYALTVLQKMRQRASWASKQVTSAPGAVSNTVGSPTAPAGPSTPVAARF
jgi:hypothetical protein